MELFLKYLLNIFSLTIAIVMAYLIVRTLTKDKMLFVNKFFKGVALLFLGAVAIKIITDIFLLNEPDALAPAVAYAKTDPKIKELIGGYKGYDYNKFNIPKDSQEYGFYNFTINGNHADLSIDCYVSKNNEGDWYLVKIANQQLLAKK